MNRLIMKLALALLPPNRRAWGEAMKGEFGSLPEGQSGFAFGCLAASVQENFLTIQGWARFGFFAIAVLAVKTIFEFTQHAVFWVKAEQISNLARFNYIADQISGMLISGVTLFLVFKIVSKVISIALVIDFGVKLVVFHIAGLVSFALFTMVNVISYTSANDRLPVLQDFWTCAPIIAIFMLVGIYGWRGARQLHNGALVALIAITLLGTFGFTSIGIFVRPEDSVLTPFASLLGMKSETMQDGLVYLLDPPLAAIRMAIVWAVALVLLLIQQGFRERSLTSAV
jgi:hypothetical protein